ncbi:Ger(x)C family spore germination protein [Paenibacillus segetis]|uniref:Germination protein BC n=1 Tax=Paenibacillus segetis TaxID=1325360 RepID=A0ABQ1YFF8_9BACL|nr:Ger(x)C family spore germination protein [Paenibacillus segetis]GGH22601.1 germination protein BC [Paenibacillus segetis]
MNSIKRHVSLLFPIILLLSLNGCWSSKEIDNLSVNVGLAMDVGEESQVEQELAEEGGGYPKKNKITSTIQLIPEQSGGKGQQPGSSAPTKFTNVTETGDSGFQIMSQFTLIKHRNIIGHHLKVIVVSTDLLQKMSLEKLLKYILRDNDIRPSCDVLISKEKARDTLLTNEPGEVPAFHLKSLIDNLAKTNKILPPMNLTKLDGIMNSKSSYMLQNVISSKGNVELSGAGIIKGKTNQYIGALSEHDVEALSWIMGTVKGGVIKTYDKSGQVLAYEIKTANTKTKSIVEGDDISFHVNIKSEGRLIENWNTSQYPTDSQYLKETTQYFEEELNNMIHKVIHKLQAEYRVDVAGFRDRLRIQHPQVWKKVKEDWDETFSKSEITYDVKLNITDYGSSAK